MAPIWKHATSALVLWGTLLLGAGQAQTQEYPAWHATNSYGVPGFIDMPSARMQPDGELTFSLHGFDNGTGRSAVAFQLTPRIQGVFRYATIPDIEERNAALPGLERTYDRSFDIRVLLWRESTYLPDITVGIQDLGGTGILGGEYVVATKRVGNFTLNGGIGWGRFGSQGSFDNPLSVFGDRFDTRPGANDNSTGQGGQFGVDQWFRGPAAFFGGVAYHASDRLTFKAEISSDEYFREVRAGIVERDSSLNLGLDYRVSPNFTVSAAYRHGTDIGLGFTYALNPRRAPAGGGIEGAPEPVLVRPPIAADPSVYGSEWVARPESEEIVTASLNRTFDVAGLKIQSYRLTGQSAQIRFYNDRYESQAQAIGRAARAMSRSLPASIETFEIIPLNDQGLPGAAVILRRSDVEALENRPNGADEILAVAGIVDAERLDKTGLTIVDDLYPRFSYTIGPFASTSRFDPDNPLRVDLGVQAKARFEPTPGLVFSGAVRQVVVGNRDDDLTPTTSQLPQVRTNSNQFAAERGPFIPYLTAEYFFRPGPDLYGRVSAGLLERQFGGVSAELLWRPASGPLALGVEVNRVRQRDFDGGFGFQNLDATTGYVSAYYDHGGGFQSTLHVGQYLAGDRGATYELSRRFASGWEVAAFATKTNVSSEEFGEGSFDKGLRLKIPLSFFTGQPSRRDGGLTIRPIQRDGGARLNLRNRLHDIVSDQSGPQLTEDWGRFWR